MSVTGILLAIVLLAILIVIHEMGHFFAARAMKIDVREFAVGFGPKLFGWKSRKYETTFAIRLIPLGGYCAFYGEDEPGEIDRTDPRIFGNHSVWRRFLVILMGPMMNFVLAFVVAVGYYWIGGIPDATWVDPYITGVSASEPAYAAGLQARDVITEINGINMLDGSSQTLLDTLGGWKEGDPALELTVRRGEETLHLQVTPAWNVEEQRMMIGVTIGGRYRMNQTDFAGAVREGWDVCVYASGEILRTLKELFTNREVFEQVSGPVGIISIVSNEVGDRGLEAFIELLITISINLGLFNLLPIPGLDGSRLIFGVIEAIRKKPIKPEREAMVNLIGMGVLFAFMIFVTFRDVTNLLK